jgi:hypothetical protein
MCTPEQMAACPLQRHFKDIHHLAYPRNQYKTTLEKHWRDLPVNKTNICRGLHDAIHASGYVPEKPSRQDMASEIWEQGSQRATDELNRQLAIGMKALEGFAPLPPEAA